MPTENQSTRHVLMIRPHAFGPNPQTAASNAFQHDPDQPPAELQAAALREFDALVAALRGVGVAPIVFEDTDVPAKPDALFPNNWMSSHADGRVFLYPLEAPLRRVERRMDIIVALSGRHGFRITEIVDLSTLENRASFLEGTGSMVLDRVNRTAYAALSSRTHPGALQAFAQRAGYESVMFDARDTDGKPIYHTNVMLAVGRRFGVICAAAIAAGDKRAAVLSRLEATGRTVIEIDHSQMRLFAGNLLELRTADDNAVIALSQTAHDSLTASQRSSLAAFGQLLPVDVATIERVGGGSVRCMLAEIFLPRADGRDAA